MHTIIALRPSKWPVFHWSKSVKWISEKVGGIDDYVLSHCKVNLKEGTMCQIWVVMSDVYLNGIDRAPFVTLKRGDLVYQEGYAGQLGFRDPSDVHYFEGKRGGHEGYIIAEGGKQSGSWGYVAVPHSCLSDNFYDSPENLWIVADPKARDKNVTLMQAAENAQGERVKVLLSKLAKDFGTTVGKLRSYLQDRVVFREGDNWFDTARDGDRRRKTLLQK